MAYEYLEKAARLVNYDSGYPSFDKDAFEEFIKMSIPDNVLMEMNNFLKDLFEKGEEDFFDEYVIGGGLPDGLEYDRSVKILTDIFLNTIAETGMYKR